jgi:tetratricopeptide (TPR) repeat protein
VQRKLHKLDRARESAQALYGLLGGNKAKPSCELASCLELFAGIFLDEGITEEHLAFLAAALEVEKACRPASPRRVSERCRRLASALIGANRAPEARPLLHEAVETAERGLGQDEATAEALVELAQYESLCERRQAALDYLGRAMAIQRQISGEDSPALARSLEVTGGVHEAAGEIEEATGYYEKALSLRERHVGVDFREQAALLMSLAGVYTALGREPAAMELLHQAAGKLEAARDDRLGHALESLGCLYSHCGRTSEAARFLNNARAIWERDPVRYADRLARNSGLAEEIAGASAPIGQWARLRAFSPVLTGAQSSKPAAPAPPPLPQPPIVPQYTPPPPPAPQYEPARSPAAGPRYEPVPLPQTQPQPAWQEAPPQHARPELHPAEPAAPARREAEQPELTGWEELAFDYISLA